MLWHMREVVHCPALVKDLAPSIHGELLSVVGAMRSIEKHLDVCIVGLDTVTQTAIIIMTVEQLTIDLELIHSDAFFRTHLITIDS